MRRKEMIAIAAGLLAAGVLFVRPSAARADDNDSDHRWSQQDWLRDQRNRADDRWDRMRDRWNDRQSQLDDRWDRRRDRWNDRQDQLDDRWDRIRDQWDDRRDRLDNRGDRFQNRWDHIRDRRNNRWDNGRPGGNGWFFNNGRSFVPPGLAKKGGLPPGQAKKMGGWF